MTQTSTNDFPEKKDDIGFRYEESIQQYPYPKIFLAIKQNCESLPNLCIGLQDDHEIKFFTDIEEVDNS